MSTYTSTCPRCGGTVLTGSAAGTTTAVRCGGCDHGWGTQGMFDRECIARGLAGTKAARIGPEYLDADQSPDDNVTDDLKELVALVEFTTLETVEKAIEDAVSGRDEDYVGRNGAVRTQYEVGVLLNMLKWVNNEKEKYGYDDDEN